jgi:hypothetical protein
MRTRHLLNCHRPFICSVTLRGSVQPRIDWLICGCTHLLFGLRFSKELIKREEKGEARGEGGIGSSAMKVGNSRRGGNRLFCRESIGKLEERGESALLPGMWPFLWASSMRGGNWLFCRESGQARGEWGICSSTWKGELSFS